LGQFLAAFVFVEALVIIDGANVTFFKCLTKDSAATLQEYNQLKIFSHQNPWTRDKKH
jgi:hypothetical protein